MSFFDDVDEPPPTARTTRGRASASRRRAPSRRPSSPEGGGGRDRGGRGGGRSGPDQQAIQVRRGIAAVVILVVLVLVVLGVHSCQINQRNDSLRTYNNDVSSLIQQSDATSRSLFGLLGTASSSNVAALQNSMNEASANAASQLSHAGGLSVPSEMKDAHQDVVLALKMRSDGIAGIAGHIQLALGTTTSSSAVTAIAAEMARFYASDVVYKDYATHLIVSALHSAGIPVGGADGEAIAQGQFLPSVQWLVPSYVASQLHVASGGPAAKPAPGTHGHVLNSVSVGGTTLQTGSTNTIPASPPPSFSLNITNSGQNTENNVICKVTVSVKNLSAQTTVGQTTAGETTNCTVALPSAPPKGSATVTATVVPVPGEKNTSNNTLTFPVNFG